jgi:CHASE2 domain-containing sensor protein
MANAPRADEPELIAAPALPLRHAQRRLLDAGRILVTAGWLVLNYTISNRAANAEHGFIGLALLLLGVFLAMLALVASQFPGVARAAAALADAVLFYFLAPAN